MENDDNIKKILETLLTITEIVVDVKEKIDTISLEIANVITNCLIETRKVLELIIADSNYYQEIDKLIKIIDKELENRRSNDNCLKNFSIQERIKILEIKQRNSQPISNKNHHKTDEKYPENWLRDTTIDLDNVINLPPVPEDAFTNFNTPTNQLRRTSSLSSLKNIRRVKFSLQKADNDEDEGAGSSNDID